jgi:hypothetical protein
MTYKHKKNHNKTPKELLSESGTSFVDWWKSLWSTLYHISRGIYKTIDAVDSSIYSRLWPASTKIKDFGKRNIVKLLLATSLLTYTWVETVDFIKDKKAHSEAQELLEMWNSSEEMVVYTSNYPKFHQKKITKDAPLMKYFFGLDEQNKYDIILPDTLVLNPSKNLHAMWEKKLKKYGKKNIVDLDKIDVISMSDKDKEVFRIKYPIDATYLFTVKPYIDGSVVKTTLTIDEFVSRADAIAKNTEKNIATYDGWLNQNKQNLLSIIKSNLRWSSLVAYTMTELCENKEDWKANKELFDIMLQHAGVEFLALVPALYDGKTSYGLPQFTEYALYDTPEEKRWASVVNKYIQNPKDKLPGSVIDLHNREKQMQAAYMFAVYNYALALIELDDSEIKSLEKYYKTNKEDFINNITQLVAMCHHRPADKIVLKNWVKDWFSRDIYNYGVKRTQEYGKATKSNYNALK